MNASREKGRNFSGEEIRRTGPERHIFSHPLLLCGARSRGRQRGEVGGSSGERQQVMERKVVVVCAMAGFLGVLSAALGFAAEATRVKISDVQTPSGGCIYPRSPAYALGFLSALALMFALIIVNSFAGCICCKKHPVPTDTNWSVALISFIVSWCTFTIAFLLLLTGAALNNQRTEEENQYLNGYCYFVKPGVFSGGAVLSLASVALAIVYYVAVSSNKIPPTLTPQNQGIAMGEPVIPQQSSEPVFVHEDTYNRRQQIP